MVVSNWACEISAGVWVLSTVQLRFHKLVVAMEININVFGDGHFGGGFLTMWTWIWVETWAGMWERGWAKNEAELYCSWHSWLVYTSSSEVSQNIWSLRVFQVQLTLYVLFRHNWRKCLDLKVRPRNSQLAAQLFASMVSLKMVVEVLT